MNKFLIFLGGIITGVILSFIFAKFISNNGSDDEIKDFETPIKYENKDKTSFKVFQVLGNAALADEISDVKYKWYNGKTVLLMGEQFYRDQVIELENPMQIGTYSYQTKEKQLLGTTIGGNYITVPVIETKVAEPLKE